MTTESENFRAWKPLTVEQLRLAYEAWKPLTPEQKERGRRLWEGQ